MAGLVFDLPVLADAGPVVLDLRRQTGCPVRGAQLCVKNSAGLVAAGE